LEVKASITSGKYSSELVVNGKENVFHSAWLQWLFPGPDLRYNYGLARLHLEEFGKFERDLDEAFATYCHLRDIAPAGTEIAKNLDRFTVAAGSTWREGVRLFPSAEHSYRLLVTDESDLVEFKRLLEIARTKATALRVVFD
jgi:hypothetical protein